MWPHPLTHPGHPWELVVDHGGHVKLQHLDVLLNDVGGGSILLVPNQLLVGLHNVSKFVCQVILQ